MPFIFFFAIFVSVVIAFFGLGEILLLRSLNRRWWDRSPVRRFAWGLPAVGLLSFLLFVGSSYWNLDRLSAVSAAVAALSLILEVALMISLPFSGMVHWLDRLMERRTQRVSDEHPGASLAMERRRFLRGMAAAIPLATLSTAGAGVGRSFQSARVYLRQQVIEELPVEFNGLRILHLSDLHLRHYVTLDDLKDVLDRASRLSPELVLVTGDIADDLRQLPEALRLIASLAPPLNCFATLGNHEYFRGVREVRDIFDRSEIPLLVNESSSIARGKATLFLAGIDDPRYLGGTTAKFFHTCLDAALTGVRSDDFILLMSHRPDVFHYAPRRGVHFTLSGHTHGGQIGLLGRSLLEPVFPEKFLWGSYRKERAVMYTTSGMGHWFPFRLGCPPEAPVIELVRSAAPE